MTFQALPLPKLYRNFFYILSQTSVCISTILLNLHEESLKDLALNWFIFVYKVEFNLTNKHDLLLTERPQLPRQ